MPAYLDPRASVPPPRADGSVELLEAGKNNITLMFQLLGLTILIFTGLIYWYQLHIGGLAPIWSAPAIKLGAAVYVALPVLIGQSLLRGAFSPARLLIDDRGVTLFGTSAKRFLGWNEITGISTAIVGNNQSAVSNTRMPQTLTILSGSTSRLSWLPIFGVKPELLAAYIAERQNNTSHRYKIDYIPPPESTAHRHLAEAERGLHQAGNVIGIALLITSALFIAAVGVFAWRHGMI